jgi:hypothetical protein
MRGAILASICFLAVACGEALPPKPKLQRNARKSKLSSRHADLTVFLSQVKKRETLLTIDVKPELSATVL